MEERRDMTDLERSHIEFVESVAHIEVFRDARWLVMPPGFRFRSAPAPLDNSLVYSILIVWAAALIAMIVIRFYYNAILCL